MWSSPVCDSASISAILRAVGIAAFLDLKAFARAFLGDVHGCRQIAHEFSSLTLTTPRVVSAVDLIRRKTELGENFGGVLADCRRLAAQRQIVIADFDRQARNFRVHAVRQMRLRACGRRH